LALILFFSFLCGDYLPQELKSLALSLSLLIKGLLLYFLPFIIFSFAFYSFSRLKSGAVLFTVLLICMMCLSNFSTVTFSYFFGCFANHMGMLPRTSGLGEIQNVLEPSFYIVLEPLIPNWWGLCGGGLLGIFAGTKTHASLLTLAIKSSNLADYFLQKLFIPIMPLFIAGFALKFQHEGTLTLLFGALLPLLSMVLLLYICYIIPGYLICCGFNIRKAIGAFRNILPAGLVGFSTMSSSATMPVLRACVLKNTSNEDLIEALIPSVVNTHLMGDALAIPLIAICMYVGEYGSLPLWEEYIFFALGYVLAKFAAAGVPGGSIIVMIPVLETYLNFSSEMSGLILAVYVLLDCFCTAANQFGNGVFALLFEKIWSKLIKHL
jgi:hypothetical protein